ncbi:VPLPA-CTERM sorting domain-containing protein [Allohahella marinimesophila]|uniref:Secreted protein n=1 Tax=Allohahella marinimesophila TaxID=1054972 RepID=A0ABP7PA11_9GAMM
MHSFAKVALAASIGIASAQASAVSVDTDVSSLDIFYSGQYIITGDNNIPGSFDVNILSDIIESTWEFSWNPGTGANAQAVQYTLQQGGSTVAESLFSDTGRAAFSTGNLSEGNYLMLMTVVDGTNATYGFSGDINVTTLAGDVNPVPLPAAAWLFLSGIAGYAGVSLKKKKKKAA